MSLSLWFWIIYVIGLIFFGSRVYRDRTVWPDVFWWVLVALLGVGVFGGPIK